MLRRHRQKDFFEGVRIIIDESQDTAEPVDEVVEQLAIHLCFDTVDEDRERTIYDCRLGPGCRKRVSAQPWSEQILL